MVLYVSDDQGDESNWARREKLLGKERSEERREERRSRRERKARRSYDEESYVCECAWYVIMHVMLCARACVSVCMSACM